MSDDYDFDPDFQEDCDYDITDICFADPSGRSALRAGERLFPCPTCGKIAEKRSRWKMPDGSYNRLYVHKTVATDFGFRKVVESCIAREEE